MWAGRLAVQCPYQNISEHIRTFFVPTAFRKIWGIISVARSVSISSSTQSLLRLRNRSGCSWTTSFRTSHIQQASRRGINNKRMSTSSIEEGKAEEKGKGKENPHQYRQKNNWNNQWQNSWHNNNKPKSMGRRDTKGNLSSNGKFGRGNYHRYVHSKSQCHHNNNIQPEMPTAHQQYGLNIPSLAVPIAHFARDQLPIINMVRPSQLCPFRKHQRVHLAKQKQHLQNMSTQQAQVSMTSASSTSIWSTS